MQPINTTQVFSHDVVEHCLKHNVIPLMMNENIFEIAAAYHSSQRDTELRFATNRHIQVIIWPEAKIKIAQQKMNSQPSDDTQDIVKLINKILLLALQQRASDIHFEPYQTHYRIRFRVDGVLQSTLSPPQNQAKKIAARLKIMAQLNIAECRLPQDGQLTLNHQEQSQTFRVSTLPVLSGEKIVLRVMGAENKDIDISQLGLSDIDLIHYQHSLNNPQGLILVTGPTGSGKTMTLYSGLKELNQTERNICSVEDPIEIPLEGINQTQINVKTGLTFAQTLRAFLRQDPDVMMIGEIRDQETAEIAIQAAQTGHLVLSTLHTNSSYEALIRLNQMGVAHYLLASSLKLIIAQRLVRKLCHHCKRQSESPISLPANHHNKHIISHWLPVGCEHCLGGYYQRVGIYELLLITPKIQQLLLTQKNTSIQHIQEIALQEGMQTLYQSGLSLVEQGITSFSELFRVLNRLSEEVNHNEQ